MPDQLSDRIKMNPHRTLRAEFLTAEAVNTSAPVNHRNPLHMNGLRRTDLRTFSALDALPLMYLRAGGKDPLSCFAEQSAAHTTGCKGDAPGL